MKSIVSKSIFLSIFLLFSCQLQNIPLSNLGNNFNIKSIPNPSSSADYPPLTSQPLDVESDPNKIIDNSANTFQFEKQTIEYNNYAPPESAEIVHGRIIVFYHNSDKFRVRTSASVSSVNNSYAQQVNNILDKYNVESVHSFGYYDPADANRIICKDKKHKKKKNDDKKDDKKFKTKHINDNDHNNDGHHDHGKGNDDDDNDKKCSTLNYVDSALTNQKIAEEQALVGKYFNGEFPDDLSIHIYEFPETSNTREIARELKNLSFIRTAYPDVKISTQGNLESTLLGKTNNINEKYGIGSSFCDSNTSNIKCPNDDEFSSDEDYYWYWYNKHNVFKGWDVYGNTPMPKFAVIDSGVDNDQSSLDKPNYVGGFSVEYTGKILGFLWDSFETKNGDIQDKSPATSKDPYPFSHGNFVSAIIGSPRNNNQGLAGIAPSSEILAVRLAQNYLPSIAHSIKKVSEDDSIDVINLSVGIPNPDSISTTTSNIKNYGAITQDPLIAKQIEYAVSKGKVVVMSAGNDKNNYLNDKTRINGAIVVGGTTNKNPKTATPDSGTYIWDNSAYGELIDIAASSDHILGPIYYTKNIPGRFKSNISLQRR